MDFPDDFNFDWDEGQNEEETSDQAWVYMIEVVNGVHTGGVDGLYLHSAGVIKMIELSIQGYEEICKSTEADALEYLLERMRIMIAGRNIPNG